ncbi:MAG: HAD family hydrolase [Patescibacteria group bacterium]|nr:HAD family hydrolase [Patescibacteria group bacterium]
MTRKENKHILIFDFDGVLADSLKATLYCNRSVYSPKLTKKLMLKAYEGNFFKTAGKWFVPERVKDFFSLYSAQFSKIPPYKGVSQTLKKLAPAYQMAVITSNSGKVAELYLKKYHLDKYFKYVLGKEFNNSKTAKINFLLSKYRTVPAQCLFITDTLGDILEARECGIKSLALAGGFHSKPTLLKGKPAIFLKNRSKMDVTINRFFKENNK